MDQVVEQVSKIEKWFSTRFRDQWIVVEANGKSEVVKFQNYSVELDLSKEKDKLLSEGLHKSGREGRDIFVVEDRPYAKGEIGARAAMLKILKDKSAEELRAMLTLDDFVKSNMPPVTTDVDQLIALIMQTKSVKGEI